MVGGKHIATGGGVKPLHVGRDVEISEYAPGEFRPLGRIAHPEHLIEFFLMDKALERRYHETGHPPAHAPGHPFAQYAVKVNFH